MSKKIFWLAGVMVMATALFVSAPQAQASATGPVTITNVTTNKTGVNATGVTLTLTMTVNQTLGVGTNIGFGSWFNGNCPPEAAGCGHVFTSATQTGLTANVGDPDPARLNVQLTAPVATGPLTVTISNLVNPSNSGIFTVYVDVNGARVESQTPLFLGNLAVKGQIKMPDGSGANGQDGIGVNIRTVDYSFNSSAGVDQSGYYAIPVVTQNGRITSGTTYFIDVWPGQVSGVVSPDSVSFVYNGAVVTKNITLVAAKKTINVRVKYDDGTAVTTANVWANKNNGSGGVGGDVDSNGLKSLTVSGGNWNVNINCGWDQEQNAPKVCDWSYNQPPTSVAFANDSTIETESVNFIVEKTDAVIRGTVYLPDGVTPLPGGYVDIRAGEKGGAGSGIDSRSGIFIANVKAGDYKLAAWPDNQNEDLARYYSDEISVRVAENETKTLKIVMKEKTAVLSGKVLDKNGDPVASIWVNANIRNGKGWSSGQTGNDGKFNIWVQPGEWELRIDQGRNDGSDLKYISADTTVVSATVAANQSVTGLVLHVQLADATVNVKFVDADGKAVTDFWGYASCRDKNQTKESKTEFGSGVDRGMATISLLGGHTYICGSYMPPEGGRSLKEEVEVTVGAGAAKEIKLVLVDNDSVIRGWIKDQDGHVVTNAQGEVFAVEAGNWQWRPGILNSDGSFSISVLGGEGKKYMIGVHFMNSEQSGYMETQPEPDSAFLVPSSSNIIKIISVFKADTSISGTVYAPNGTVMPHVWVSADNFKQLEGKIKGDYEGGKVVRAGTETNGEGKFTLRIVSGDYTLFTGLPPEFQSTYMPPKEVDVSVTAADPATGVVLRYRNADAFVVATGVFDDGSTAEIGYCHAYSNEGGNSGKEIYNGSANIPLTEGSWFVGCDSFDPSTNKFYRSDEQMITVVTGDTVEKTFTLKEANFTIPESFSTTFTATQQNNFTLPDGTTLSIPANTVGTDDSTYTLTATPSTNLMFTESDKPLTFAWDFEVTKQGDSGTSIVETFNSNVTICMPVPMDYISDLGLTVGDIFGKYWDTTSGLWKSPDSAIINEEEGTACLQVNHFTEFALTTGETLDEDAGPSYIVATPASVGGPQVTVWDSAGNAKLNFFAFSSNLRIGIQAVSGDLNGDGTNEIIVAPGAGTGPQIRIFDLRGQVIDQFFAFSSHIRSGIKVAVADVNGDNKDEIIVTTDAGAGPQVRIFDGNGHVLSQFFAYASAFRGGVELATGDVDGDDALEIITVPASQGGSQVRVFDYDGKVVSQFFAYARSVRGGFHVTAGDVDGDGTADIVVSAGAGLGPQVAIFDGEGNLINRFFAYASAFRGGFHVSIGDADNDGSNEVVTTPQSQAGPQVRVFDYDGKVVSQFFAYASHLRGGFTTMVTDIDQDGANEIVTAPGEGMGPQVRTFDYTGHVKTQFFTHHVGFRGGINFSSVPIF